jgi:hypothetical protein
VASSATRSLPPHYLQTTVSLASVANSAARGDIAGVFLFIGGAAFGETSHGVKSAQLEQRSLAAAQEVDTGVAGGSQSDPKQSGFDRFNDFVKNQGVERTADQDVVHERIADSLDQIPESVRNWEPDDAYGRAVDDLGAHEFNQRLPGGYHVTTEMSGGPVSVHQDAHDPLRGPLENYRHFRHEVIPLTRGTLNSTHVNRNTD